MPRSSTVPGCVAAFLLASLAATAANLALGWPLAFAPSIFLIALGHALVLGLPLFLLVLLADDRRYFTAVSCTITGALIGGLPMSLWTLPVYGEYFSFNGVVYVEHGVRTTAGWYSWMRGLLFNAGYGALGGLVFWTVLKASGFLAIPSTDARA